MRVMRILTKWKNTGSSFSYPVTMWFWFLYCQAIANFYLACSQVAKKKKPLSDFELAVSDEENIDQRLADFFSRDQIVNILGFVDYPVCTTTQLHSFHAVETRKQP